jgi:SAM-dependent methyltransferase
MAESYKVSGDFSNDELVDLAWIKTIESPGANVRELDVYPMLREWIQRIEPVDLLDLGCGQGICSDKINLDGRSYTGVDRSKTLISRANEIYRSQNRNFLVGNAYQIPADDSFFDAVFSINLIHLLEDLNTATKEMARVLKPGGHFFMVTANPDSYELWIDFYSETNLVGKRLEGISRQGEQPATKDVLFLHTNADITSTFNSNGLIFRKTSLFREHATKKDCRYYLAFEGQKSP